MVNVKKRSLANLDYYPIHSANFLKSITGCSAASVGFLTAVICAMHVKGRYDKLPLPKHMDFIEKPPRRYIIEHIFLEHIFSKIPKTTRDEAYIYIEELISGGVLRLSGRILYYDQMIQDEKDYASGKNNFKIN